MKVCKSCGTVLDSSFSLGSKCPNCKIKIVYEDSLPVPFSSKIKGWLEIFAVFVGIAIIVFIIGSLVYFPFSMYFLQQDSKVVNQYQLIVADMEHNLTIDGSQESIAQVEEYVERHIEEFELFADKHNLLDGLLFSSVHSMEENENVSGAAAIYIAINKDKFTNKEVIKLFDRIGFYNQTNMEQMEPFLLKQMRKTNIIH
jgi:DNA-directed RNA polymerase subunit RPC12/RpoP